ncbi:MAG TPA: HD domain-containing protein [Tepidiformaceae bacterium]|nr:HD domain-containing protein [Tepidiformaceae bacterium]
MASLGDLIDALEAADAASALRDLDERGRLTALLPDLEAGRGFQQPELHYYDVLQHNLAAAVAFDAATGRGEDGTELREVIAWVDLDESLSRRIDGLSLRAVTRLACLLHDVAKPRSAAQIDGRLRFPRHGPLGAEMMSERLPQIGFRPEVTDLVSRLIRYHLRPAELVRTWPPTDRAVRRFVNDLDGHVLPLMLVNLSDGWATRGPGYTRENFRRHCAFMNYVLARAWGATEEDDPPLVSGDDLIRELDLQSGRLLGAILTSLRRAQSDGAITDRNEALAYARHVLAALPAEES